MLTLTIAATYAQVFVTNGPNGRATTTTSHHTFTASDVCTCPEGVAAVPYTTKAKNGSPTTFYTAKPTIHIFDASLDT